MHLEGAFMNVFTVNMFEIYISLSKGSNSKIAKCLKYFKNKKKLNLIYTSMGINCENDAIEELKPTEKVEEEVKPNSMYSSSSWKLDGRKLVGKIPNPVYTCNGSGKVVVKIEVNGNGYVIDTKVDKRRSSTRNECLFDNAMEYARKALFSKSSLEEQEGTITYFFNYSE